MIRGSYALLLYLEDDTRLRVGKLGLLPFSKGYYLYLGSALGGLWQRVGRHLRTPKSPRWHIDYLLPQALILEVWYQVSPQRLECLWRQRAQDMPQAQVPFPGFGSSDCRCPSHLLHFSDQPSYAAFQELLGKGGEDLKRHSAPPRPEESRGR